MVRKFMSVWCNLIYVKIDYYLKVKVENHQNGTFQKYIFSSFLKFLLAINNEKYSDTCFKTKKKQK